MGVADGGAAGAAAAGRRPGQAAAAPLVAPHALQAHPPARKRPLLVAARAPRAAAQGLLHGQAAPGGPRGHRAGRQRADLVAKPQRGRTEGAQQAHPRGQEGPQGMGHMEGGRSRRPLRTVDQGKQGLYLSEVNNLSKTGFQSLLHMRTRHATT